MGSIISGEGGRENRVKATGSGLAAGVSEERGRETMKYSRGEQRRATKT